MRTGDIVEALIGNAQTGWASLTYKGYAATLLQTELTWKARAAPSVKEFLNGKSSVPVRVMEVYENRFSASIKQLDKNPWHNPIEPGQAFTGNVVRVMEYGYFIRIDWYCDALLKLDNCVCSYTLGDEVSVKVKTVDAENQRVAVVEA